LDRLQGILAVGRARFDGKVSRTLKRMGQAFEHHRVRVSQNKVNAHGSGFLSMKTRTASAF
jgi:hypothetical protein